MTLCRSKMCAWLLAGVVLTLSPLASALHGQSAKGAKSKTLTPDQQAGREQFDPRAQASTLGGAVVEERVAQVNDQIISRSDYDRAEAQLTQEGQQQGWKEQELAEHKKDLLRDLIDQQLLLSKGKELGITGDTELVRRLDDIRKQNHLDSLEDLEKAATQQGVSYEDFKQNIRNGIITQQVIREQVGRRLQLTQAELQRYYDQHKDQFTQPESVHLGEILIPVAAGGDEATNLAAAKLKADDLAAKLKGGASFEELAKTSSAGSTAAQGGDLGEFKRGSLAKPLEDATFALQAGQVTEPIRTKQGYVILKVTQHAPGGVQSLDAVRPQVEEAAFTTRMQPALRAFLEQARQNAYIDIRTGYTDTAGVPNSVKPLYSAYTPPAPKKKQHFQRTRYTGARRGRHAGSASDAAPTAGGAAATTDTAATGADPIKSDAVKADATKSDATAPAAAGTRTRTTASGTTTAVAAAPRTQKLGKKEKIRYGQAPRESLPAATTEGTAAPTDPADANAGKDQKEQQVASAGDVSSSSDLPDTVAPEPVERKTRFSDRARQPKGKKVKSADQLENERLDKPSTDETAARQEQSAPLGLAGDTATKKKAPRVKGDKTRYSDEAGRKEAAPAVQPSTTPSPLAPSSGGDAPTATTAPGTPPAANPPAPAPPQP